MILKIREDMMKHYSSCIFSSMREVNFMKKHLGCRQLHEKVAEGYAVLSFEDSEA
jgi:hypothetical protein